MVAKFFLVALVLASFDACLSGSADPVPLLMWRSTGSGSLPSGVSKSCKPSAKDFRTDVLEKLDGVDNILLFLQESLSVEDFSRYGKGGYEYLSSIFENTTAAGRSVFLPKVPEASDSCEEVLSSNRKTVEVNEVADASRLKTILKSSPRNLIIIRLQVDQGSRLDNVIDKDAEVRKFVVAAEAVSDSLVSIYTGEKPAPLVDIKQRSKREVKGITMDGKCVDISAKSIKIEEGLRSEKVIEIPDQSADPTEEVCDMKNSRSVLYDLTTNDPELTNIQLRFNFKVDGEKWELSKLVADTFKNGEATHQDLTTVQKISKTVGTGFTALNPIEFVSADKKLSVTFDNIEVNPFATVASVQKAKVRAAEPTTSSTYFSIPILSALTVGILYIIIMIWALEGITSIKTMDQFDDPRGKSITVPQAD